jgi:hypothetical protein
LVGPVHTRLALNQEEKLLHYRFLMDPREERRPAPEVFWQSIHCKSEDRTSSAVIDAKSNSSDSKTAMERAPSSQRLLWLSRDFTKPQRR